MTMPDPFAAPAPGGDFLSLDQVAPVKANLDGTIVGRLALITPSSLQTDIPGKPTPQQPNPKPYSAVYCELVLLDGPVSEHVPQIPMVLPDFRISGGYIVTSVKNSFVATGLVPAGRESEYVLTPKPGQPGMLLARLIKAKNAQGSLSWMLSPEPFTADDAAKARAYIASKPAPTDPFV